MTEEAIVIPADESSPESAPTREEMAAKIWEKHSAPITKEEVKGDRPEPEQPTIPDRELVAPKIAELLAEKKTPEVSPLEERLARIEAALTQPAPEPEPADVTSQVEELRNLLLSEREEKAAREAEAAESEKWDVLREGVVANIRGEAEEFPALVALGQEENVYHTVRAELEAGRTVSEYDVASQAESKLRAVYDKLHAAFDPTNQEPSEDPKSSDAVDTTPTTLTPGLSSGDEALDIESLIANGVDRREAARRIWEAKEKA
jgi:hypothetical protein